MYGSHSMYAMTKPINYRPFYSKVYPLARNEHKSKTPTLSNYCFHNGDQMLPDCNICSGSEAGQEMMNKYLHENQMYSSYIKNQEASHTSQFPCSPPVDNMLIRNETFSDKTASSGNNRHKSPAQNSSINTDLFDCNLCSKSFSHESQLLDHKHTHHHIYQCEDKNTDKYQVKLTDGQSDCGACTDSFTYKNDHQNYLRTHLGLKPFICSQCPKTFAQRTNLKNHERIHTGEKPYNCDVCHRSFSQRGNLNMHRRTHGGEKGFVCEICFKAFSQKGNLKNHARTHTGERPFQCKDCEKTFSQRTDLRNHERVHTGEKPFVCTVCSKGFSQRANLKIHGRTHTGEKPFGCGICGKNFSQKGNLKCHLRTHCCDKTIAIFA